jgi:hypothetical protein
MHPGHPSGIPRENFISFRWHQFEKQGISRMIPQRQIYCYGSTQIFIRAEVFGPTASQGRISGALLSFSGTQAPPVAYQ